MILHTPDKQTMLGKRTHLEVEIDSQADSSYDDDQTFCRVKRICITTSCEQQLMQSQRTQLTSRPPDQQSLADAVKHQGSEHDFSFESQKDLLSLAHFNTSVRCDDISQHQSNEEKFLVCQEKVEEIRSQILSKPLYVPAQQFGDAVHIQQDRAVFMGQPNVLRCLICDKGFSTSWRLNQHHRQVHERDTQYSKERHGESFKCRICQEDFKSKHLLKAHQFELHTDVEAMAFYQKGLEQLVGAYYLQRLRPPLLNIIMRGHIDQHIGKLLNPVVPVDISKVKRTFYLHMVDEEDDGELRREIMRLKRQTLLNLAHTASGLTMLSSDQVHMTVYKDLSVTQVYDLRDSPMKEMQGHYILLTLQWALKATKHQHKNLPHYVRLSRRGSELSLLMSKYPVSLRSLLNDRPRLEAQARSVVLSLLTAYLKLDEQVVTVRNICPQRVFLESDLGAAMFADTTSISGLLQEEDIECKCAEPYLGKANEALKGMISGCRSGDMYRVCLCLLEVLIGSKCVMLLTHPRRLHFALGFVEKYCAKQTFKLLQWGLLRLEEADFNDYYCWLHGHQEDMIAVDMRRLAVARGDSVGYDNFLEEADENWHAHHADYKVTHDIV